MVQRFDLVEILGKRSRKVPVILTPDVKDAISTLIIAREKGCVCKDNDYVFAVNDGQSMHNLRGNDVLRNVCQMVKLGKQGLLVK